jgi:hypothetical protein
MAGLVPAIYVLGSRSGETGRGWPGIGAKQSFVASSGHE